MKSNIEQAKEFADAQIKNLMKRYPAMSPGYSLSDDVKTAIFTAFLNGAAESESRNSLDNNMQKLNASLAAIASIITLSLPKERMNSANEILNMLAKTNYIIDQHGKDE